MKYSSASKHEIREFISMLKHFIKTYGFSTSETAQILGLKHRTRITDWCSGRRHPSIESIHEGMIAIHAVQVAFVLKR